MANQGNRFTNDDDDIQRFRFMPPEQVADELRKAKIDPSRAIERVKELVSQKLKEWSGGRRTSASRHHRRMVHEALMWCFTSLQELLGCVLLHLFAEGTVA